MAAKTTRKPKGKAAKAKRQAAAPLAAARVDVTPELFEQLLARIIDGAMLDKLCAGPGMPSRSAVYAYMRKHPEARVFMDEAVEGRADWRASKISDLAAKVEANEIDPQSARVAIDAHRFMIAKEAPRRYGDKVELTGKDGNAIEVKDTTQIELAREIGFMLARARAAIDLSPATNGAALPPPKTIAGMEEA
jgi:hypothetical protein